jgi:hypothetical protein
VTSLCMWRRCAAPRSREVDLMISSGDTSLDFVACADGIPGEAIPTSDLLHEFGFDPDLRLTHDRAAVSRQRSSGQE